ncbi:hypothetical protein [Vibrio vulnificus YJ016]|uniref:Uncharacterized protein n=1 Tax=Vibrio vulnificus (strain YJ016) TaxID=196600 RepID=Q7MDS6_VIBVY|nr:hypothetical protein [Vibrio vulnificus YJ016]
MASALAVLERLQAMAAERKTNFDGFIGYVSYYRYDFKRVCLREVWSL